MKIAVRCTGCSREYLLDEAFAETVLPCPACGAVRGLNAQAAAAPPARADAARAAAPPVRAVAPPAAERPAAAERATVAVAPEAEEVVCPRCNLHFVPRRSSTEASTAARRTVLVVESMEYFRDIVRDALTSHYEVKTAADLGAARRHLAQGRVDLIVLARKLDGGESGIDLLRELRVKPCPIVIFTDQDESEIYGANWTQLRSLGADDLVVKGLNAGESLLRKTRSLLGEQWDADE